MSLNRSPRLAWSRRAIIQSAALRIAAFLAIGVVLAGIVVPRADPARAVADESTGSVAANPDITVQNAAGDHAMGSGAHATGALGDAPESGTTVRALGGAPSSTYPKGFDISAWQPNSGINWAGVKAGGAKFVYIKATEGTTYTSSQFDAQWASASNAGLYRGAYVFAQPAKADGAATADYFVAHGGGWTADGRTLPPLLDIENDPSQPACYGLSAQAMVAWIAAFSREMVHKTGRTPAVYTNISWWKTCTGNSAAFGDNPYVPAYWPSQDFSGPGTLGASWATWNMWQWADAGAFPGDQEVFNGSMSVLQSYANGSVPVSTAPVTRMAGADAIATSIAESQATFASGVSKVFIATRNGYADALAGAAAAGAAGGPVLLVGKSSVDSAVIGELRRLNPKDIVVLGGPSTIGQSIVDSLASYTAGTVTRQYGADRFATSVQVSKAAWATTADTVYLASGSTFVDAVSGSAVAASATSSGPVLLTPPGHLPGTVRAEIERLHPAHVVVIGGPSSVSATAQNEASNILLAQRGETATRESGANRFGTAAAVARAHIATASTVYLATGANYPDALTGGTIAGRNEAPLLLLTRNEIPAETRAAIIAYKPSKIVVLGGSASVSAAVAALL